MKESKLTIRLQKDLLDRVIETAKDTGLSKGAIIRHLLGKYFETTDILDHKK